VVEHSLGKGEVDSSILSGSTRKQQRNQHLLETLSQVAGHWRKSALTLHSRDRCSACVEGPRQGRTACILIRFWPNSEVTPGEPPAGGRFPGWPGADCAARWRSASSFSRANSSAPAPNRTARQTDRRLRAAHFAKHVHTGSTHLHKHRAHRQRCSARSRPRTRYANIYMQLAESCRTGGSTVAFSGINKYGGPSSSV
jgi:hypothetical protein